MLCEEFVKLYYSYIKEKAQQYSDENSCLNIESKGKAKFFANLKTSDLLDQLENVQKFLKIAYEVI